MNGPDQLQSYYCETYLTSHTAKISFQFLKILSHMASRPMAVSALLKSLIQGVHSSPLSVTPAFLSPSPNAIWAGWGVDLNVIARISYTFSY